MPWNSKQVRLVTADNEVAGCYGTDDATALNTRSCAGVESLMISENKPKYVKLAVFYSAVASAWVAFFLFQSLERCIYLYSKLVSCNDGTNAGTKENHLEGKPDVIIRSETAGFIFFSLLF